jgi:hypothetical protein
MEPTKKAPAPKKPDDAPRRNRREFERLELPATAFALNTEGTDLGRVVEVGGGGLMLDPATPWARVSLTKGQQLVLTIVEPGTGNRHDVTVEVCYIRSHTIGLRFL